MRKYLKGKYWKRRLALLLAVSMILTANVFSIDAVSVYAAESEDEAVQNDNDTALEEGKESEVINEDSEPIPDNEGGEDPEGENEESGSLPDNEDESSPAEDEEPLQDADDVEEPIAEVSENGERIEDPTYVVLKLDDETALKEVMKCKELLWETPADDGGYKEQWKETGSLNTYLAGDGMEYVVIQQIPQSSIKPEDKILELPANIKGVFLNHGWDEDADAPADLQLNKLGIKGTETSVYLSDLVIDTDGNKFTIDFSAAENNNSKVLFKHSVVNAQIGCESTAGTIGFIETNILEGYSVKCTTDFSKVADYAELLINGEAGLSFEEITGDMDVSIVFNGYPKSTESLPHFNKKIDLGVGTDTDEEGNESEYNRGIGISFWEHKDNPFWLNGNDEGWWEAVPAVKLEKGTQIAYFAGRKLIGENVHYHSHYTGKDETGSEIYENDGLYLNSVTGKLEMTDENVPEESAAYSVLKLDDEISFNAVKANQKFLWSPESDEEKSEEYYGDLWDATDYLTEYLARDGMEYVVIQATPRSHNSESKKLEIPGNIKGALLIYGWDDAANEGTGATMKWQLDQLSIKGAETSVYLFRLDIDTVGNDKFTIDFSATENNSSKVVLKHNAVNAQIYCGSTAGKICFMEQNILGGYSVKCKTVFSTEEFSEDEDKFANLLINGDAGLSFEEITGDMAATLVFNGYPEDKTESLPHFNKEINLGKETDTDENGDSFEHYRGIDISFWQRKELPFWLDGTNGWWEAVPAVTLEEGTRVAYFAGRNLIGENVHYYSHYTGKDENGTEVNENELLYLNSSTGRLEMAKEGAIEERAAYGVLKLENKADFDGLMENDSPMWDDENGYGKLWDETDYLDQYLARDGMEYVVIQATRSLHNSENRSLELPVNIKGVLLLSEHYNEDDEDYVAAWPLNTIKAVGSKEIHILDAGIDPMNHEVEDSDAASEDPELKIEATEAGVNVVVKNSEIMGDLSLSDIADVKFIDSKVFGATDLGSNKPTVSLEGQIVADNLSGYSALEINGNVTLIVRYHGEVVIENCTLNKTSVNPDEGQSLMLVYNGYPQDASLLPVFGDNIVLPDNCGIILRFVQQSDDVFWEGEWWDDALDAPLLIGSQIATVNIDENKFESLMEKFNCHNTENIENAELVRDETGALRIQKRSENGKRVVDFVLSVGNTKTYDGTAFTVSESDVTNNCGYTGSVDLAWMTKAGTELEQAPKDAGEYKLKMSVPADTQDYEGETQADITITPKTVTVSVKPNENKAEGYEIIWTGFVGEETYTTQAEIETGDEITEDGVKYHMVSTKDGAVSSNYTIVHADPVKIPVKEAYPKGEGLRIVFNDGKVYTYTGTAIKPSITVWNNADKLVEGTDYTVRYTNNIKASETMNSNGELVAINTNEKKFPTVTVTGKGNLSGKTFATFKINPKDLEDKDAVGAVNAAEVAANGVKADAVVVLPNKKAAPVLLYGGVKLAARDYEVTEVKGSIDDTKLANAKWAEGANEDDIDDTITLTAKKNGNFTGAVKIKVIVATAAQQKAAKMKAVFKDVSDKTQYYKAESITPEIIVSNSDRDNPKSSAETIDENKKLSPGVDFVISYPADTTNVGTKKVMITGTSVNCIGTVTLTYSIKPAKKTDAALIAVRNPEDAVYDYVSTGVTVGDDLTVSYKYGEKVVTPLVEGIDYKVTYTNNKKASTATASAAYVVTGLGNYKGLKTDKQYFTIKGLVLSNDNKSENAGEGIQLIVADKIYKNNAVYKSVPSLIVNGELVKTSEYTVKYSLDETAEKTWSTNPGKIELGEKENSKTVYVKVEPKPNKVNYIAEDGKELTASYNVVRTTKKDLSGAKITLQDENGRAAKVAYTGNEVTPYKALIKIKGLDDITIILGGQNADYETKGFKVTYANNVLKGKATVVIEATDSNDKVVGSKSATFNIVQKNLLTGLKEGEGFQQYVANIFKSLFDN